MGVIEAKRSGEGVKRAVESEAPAAPDLLAALQASLDEVKKPAKKKSPAKPAAKAGAGGGRATATRGRRAG
jgi:non-homologous end joining protein Ku